MAQAVAPKLTIAIPFYRDLAYLSTAIASVRAQTTPDWELLVVDDSGSDEPADAVASLVASFGDPRIRAHRNLDTLIGQCGELLLVDSAVSGDLHGTDASVDGAYFQFARNCLRNRTLDRVERVIMFSRTDTLAEPMVNRIGPKANAAVRKDDVGNQSLASQPRRSTSRIAKLTIKFTRFN